MEAWDTRAYSPPDQLERHMLRNFRELPEEGQSNVLNLVHKLKGTPSFEEDDER